MKKTLLGFVFIISALSELNAATFIVPEDRDLFAKSHAVVVGSVLTTYGRYDDNGAIITVAEIRIEEVILGMFAPGSVLRVVSLGGRVGDVVHPLPGSPSYIAGTRVLSFLRQVNQERWITTDFAVGKFEFTQDVRGQTLLVRQEGELEGWDMQMKPFQEKRREAGRFLAYLRKLAAGRTTEPDYFVPAHELQAQKGGISAQVVVATPTSYTLDFDGTVDGTGRGGRRTTFPAPVGFVHTTPITNGSAAITSAMALWNNDCASNVNLVNNGFSAASQAGTTASDGINSVRFEVNLGSPFSCTSGGLLGFGRAWASGTHSFNMVPFFTIAEGDVDMNQGIGACSEAQFSQVRRAAAIAHELGHTMGFRHSDQNRNSTEPAPCADPLPCSSNAVMTAVQPQDATVLRQWDIDAVRALYPGGTCALGDFNGNGTSDIVWRHAGSGQNAVWFMNIGSFQGAALFPAVIDLNWTIGGTSDMTGDGQPDLIWRNNTTGQNAGWRMNGTSYQNSFSIPFAPPGWQMAGTADFSGDGKADIVWRNYSNGQNACWVMGDNGAFQTAFVFPAITDTNWRIVAVGDFTGDGRSDLIWRHSLSGANAGWVIGNNGQYLGSFNIPAVTDPNWQINGAADFQGDGKLDLIWRNYLTGANALWIMDYNGLYGGSLGIPGNPDLNWQIVGPR